MAYKAAQRYATSLLQVAIEQEKVDDLLADMRLLNQTMEQSRDLVLFLKSPIIKRDKKKKVMVELFGNHVTEITAAFIEILIRKGRELLLPDIVTAFIRKYNEYAGIINIKVVTARKLSESEIKNLQSVLEKKTKKTVQLDISVDSGLMGGLKVRIEDTVIDGTVKHKMEELESLFRGSVSMNINV